MNTTYGTNQAIYNSTISTKLNASIAPTVTDLKTLNNISICVSFIVLIIGAIGNLAVLTIFGRRWKCLKACEIFMINLAIADLIGSVVIPSQLILNLLHYNMHPIGHVGCKIISYTSITCITVSSFTLVIISVDRFIIVKWQFRRVQEHRTLVLINVVVWFVGGTFGIVYLTDDWIALHKKENSNTYSCASFASSFDRRIHFLVTCSFQVIIPFIIIATVSIMIITLLKTNAKNTLLKNSSREYRKRARISRKAIKLILVIVFAFFICQLPVNLFFFAMEFKLNELPDDVTVCVYYVLHLLEISSTCINPLIYCKLHTKFRKNTVKRFYSWCLLLYGKPVEKITVAKSKTKGELIKINTLVTVALSPISRRATAQV